MPSDTKDRPVSVRIPSDTDAWAREKERELLAMFNEAAAAVTAEDREERESLLDGFADAALR